MAPRPQNPEPQAINMSYPLNVTGHTLTKSGAASDPASDMALLLSVCRAVFVLKANFSTLLFHRVKQLLVQRVLATTGLFDFL